MSQIFNTYRMNTFSLRTAVLTLLISNTIIAQTTWNGAEDGAFWDTVGNWSNGLPSTSNGAIFNTATAATGLLTDFTIASLTFNTGVGEGDIITNLGGGKPNG